jgi:hypothetical protein
MDEGELRGNATRWSIFKKAGSELYSYIFENGTLKIELTSNPVEIRRLSLLHDGYDPLDDEEQRTLARSVYSVFRSQLRALDLMSWSL